MGIKFDLRKFPADITQEELIKQVRAMNEDENVHGCENWPFPHFINASLRYVSSFSMIVQLPLPSHINEKAVLEQVGLAKDADGFDPLNIGLSAARLALKIVLLTRKSYSFRYAGDEGPHSPFGSVHPARLYGASGSLQHRV